MRARFIILAALAAVTSAASAAPAAAQSVVSTGQSFVRGHLLTGERQADGSRLVGLRLTLADGWKTYWRSPGAAGIAPTFDWTGSDNVASVRVLWPRPEVFDSFGLQTIGYSGQVVLPMIVTPKDPDGPMRLQLAADMGVCNEICVLEHFELGETIAKDQRAIGAPQIAQAVASVPPSGPAAGLSKATCRITGAGRDRRLQLQLAFGAALADPVVVVEGTDSFWVSDVVTRQTGPGSVDVEARLSLASDGAWVTRQDLRMTVLATNLAADIRGCTAPAG